MTRKHYQLIADVVRSLRMNVTFTIIEKGGLIPSDDPRTDAYRYMTWLTQAGRHYSVTFDKFPDEITVESPGLMTFTFYRRKSDE